MSLPPQGPNEPGSQERGPDDTERLDLTLPLASSADFETALRRREESEQAPRATEWALVVYAGANLGRVFPLVPGEILLGRSTQASVILLDEEVSRIHARITMQSEPGGVVELALEDLGSTNGTLINGQAAVSPTLLVPGDRIYIGNHVLKLVLMDSLERSFHETLLDQSTKDPLTGLGNRGVTLTELQNRFELSRRHGRPLSVVMCDLDHFKLVNDTHGHGAGDAVLAAFGEKVRANLRGTDLAGRIGGEEFLMILPETELEGAMLMAERLRSSIGAVKFPPDMDSLLVTCSLGVAERVLEDRDGGALLGRADSALYQAKQGGRNRVVAARRRR